jgi:hypothetical protein
MDKQKQGPDQRVKQVRRSAAEWELLATKVQLLPDTVQAVFEDTKWSTLWMDRSYMTFIMRQPDIVNTMRDLELPPLPYHCGQIARYLRLLRKKQQFPHWDPKRKRKK